MMRLVVLFVECAVGRCASILYVYFMNIRSERKTYLLPLVTGEPSCSKQSLPWLATRDVSRISYY